MQKKIKMRKMIIFVLAIIIAFLAVSFVSGEKEVESVVLLKEKVDLTKTLDQQLEKLEIIQLKKSASQKLGNSVVRNLGKDIKGKRLMQDLEPGTPIPKALLSNGEDFGEFTSVTPINRTLYKLKGGIQQLPPGVEEGNKVDIGLKSKDKISLLYKGIKIARITETDIYLDVSQKDHYRLLLAEEVGEFVLQLPGTKKTTACSALSPSERELVECYNENDGPQKVDTEEIMEKINTGEPFDEVSEMEEAIAQEDSLELKNEDTAEGSFSDLLIYYEENNAVETNSNEEEVSNETEVEETNSTEEENPFLIE